MPTNDTISEPICLPKQPCDTAYQAFPSCILERLQQLIKGLGPAADQIKTGRLRQCNKGLMPWSKTRDVDDVRYGLGTQACAQWKPTHRFVRCIKIALQFVLHGHRIFLSPDVLTVIRYRRDRDPAFHHKKAGIEPRILPSLPPYKTTSVPTFGLVTWYGYW